VDEDEWEPLADQFVSGHYGSIRGRVRTHVIDRHLREHLPPPPGRIVDVGGGAGHQSLPLARAGYDVTIVDPSPAMLARAEQLIALEPPEVSRRITLVEASGEDASRVLDSRFSAVLCHGVVMYLDDPTLMLDSLCELARPGGVVSIVAKNVEVMAVLPALAGDWETALAAFSNDHQINGLGVETRGDRREALAAMLVDRQVDPIAWYGVRLFTDGWTPDRVELGADDIVFAVEYEASRRDPYRQLSRLFHLLGRRIESE